MKNTNLLAMALTLSTFALFSCGSGSGGGGGGGGGGGTNTGLGKDADAMVGEYSLNSIECQDAAGQKLAEVPTARLTSFSLSVVGKTAVITNKMSDTCVYTATFEITEVTADLIKQKGPKEVYTGAGCNGLPNAESTEIKSTKYKLADGLLSIYGDVTAGGACGNTQDATQEVQIYKKK